LAKKNKRDNTKQKKKIEGTYKINDRNDGCQKRASDTYDMER
jgi:hypothetical protein